MATIDWAAKKDEEAFCGSEQPGSQFAYERGLEIQRRLYLLQKTAAEQQVMAIAEQREATVAQREAIAEMRRQSTIMFWSVIGIFATALVTLAAAIPPRSWHSNCRAKTTEVAVARSWSLLLGPVPAFG